MLQFVISRRAALSLGGSILLVTGFAKTAIAQSSLVTSADSACSVIDSLLVNASADAADAGAWAVTLDPTAVERLLSGIAQLRAELEGLPEQVDAARTVQLLDYVDAVGGLLLLIGGVAAGIAGATAMSAGILVGGVAFAGAMLLVRGVVAPQSMSTESFLMDVGGDRIPMVLDAFGADTVVVSRNAASYFRTAGTVTSLAFTVYGFCSFAQSTAEFQRGTAELQRLRDELAAAEAELAELRNFETLQATRRACAQAVQDDLSTLRAGICLL